MEISAPISLARLPRASRHDGFHVGTSYTLRDGVKRRRKEICVAVDGDSLSLYEILNGAILASYPVPPTSRFIGPPCSICERVDGETTRKTYCAINRESLRVECFKGSKDDTPRPISNASLALHDQESPVVLLELIVEAGQQYVLVVQQNGSLTIFSEDLQTKLLEASLSSRRLENSKILAIRDLTFSQAHKTILRQRPDVASAAMGGSSYLAVAYCQPGLDSTVNDLRYGVWMIDLAPSNPVINGGRLPPLFEHDLPLGAANSASKLKDRSCTFSSKVSNLFVRAGHTFFSYDLTGLIPKLASTLHPSLTGTYEIMAISPAFAISSSEESLQLYDLKYQSVQGQRDTKQRTRKRKRDIGALEGTGTIDFVAYYPQSARIVGRRRNQLLAIDVSAGSTVKLFATGSKLLQNIGRGIRSHAAKPSVHEKLSGVDQDSSAASSKPGPAWEHVRQRLDQLANASDVAGFESTFVDSVRNFEFDPSTFHQADDLPKDGTSLPAYKVDYLLSKIFRVATSASVGASEQNTAEQSLKIQILSTKLTLWLSGLGLLSGRRVGIAIASTTSYTGEAIAVQAVAQALLDTDSSCALLVGCLANGFSPYVEEQAAVVRLLIQRALETSADMDMGGAGPILESNGLMDIDSSSNALETQVQTEDLWSPTSLQGALTIALDKFGTAAALSISSNLRGQFSQREVLALTQFLRQQLFQAGHTRSFQSYAVDGDTPRTVKLDAAVKILSGCVDAIGPLGFFGSLDNEDFIGKIIPELAAEITNTKQSLEDVAELQSILREALRYQESVQRKQAAGGRLRPFDMGNSSQQRSGAIMTIYSEAVEGDEGLQPDSALPLSLRVENVVKPVKVRKGGGQVKQRSVWQKKMLERRNKGQYSFERLVL